MKSASIQVSESSLRRFSKSSNLLPQSSFMHRGFTLLSSEEESSGEPSLLPPTEDDPLFFFLFLVILFFFFFWAAALCKAHNTSDPLRCLPSPTSSWSRMDLKRVVSPSLDAASFRGCAERWHRWPDWAAAIWGKLETGMAENDRHEMEDAPHMLASSPFSPLCLCLHPVPYRWAKRWGATPFHHLLKRHRFSCRNHSSSCSTWYSYNGYVITNI